MRLVPADTNVFEVSHFRGKGEVKVDLNTSWLLWSGKLANELLSHWKMWP